MDSLPPSAALLPADLRPRHDTITMYSTTWCGDCRLAKHVLGSEQAAYVEIDLDRHPEAAELVTDLNGGFRSVPTIVFPDGTVLVEPSRRELLAALEAQNVRRSA